LLRRLLAGERLAPVRALTELNRVQPIVKLVTVATSAGDPGLVDVTVEVKRAEREFLRQGKTVSIATEVYDLRLFRDGQIVGQWPRPTADPNSAAAGGAASLESWRRSNTVSLDAATGAATMTFKSIRLPRREGTQTIEFTAYAFNEDRVKSETARLPYDVPADLTARKGRAYVVTFGVNLSQNPAFDLRYAAPDALALSQALLPRVSGTGVFEEVVDVPLVSDYEIKDGVKVPVQVSATKANLKAVLDRLAGRESDAEAASRVRGIDRIRPARPEDMLILSFSSHGVADGSGGFFFLPYDVGPGRTSEITQDVLARAISSDELSAWLREVDAGQIAIIADACHSAATVDAQGFKPGPMGSRGLGQLAYDKRIMLLAASQAADVAFEYDALQHGLLTYALVQDGLSNGAADHRPRDGEVRLNEWLSFGADRVPKLDQAIREKRFDALGLDPARTRGLLIAPGAPGFQSPVLFDFSGNRPSATIAR
jgi:hypothetical protein